MSARSPGPIVSIVTPSLNMGRFIEAAIESVLSQDYPRVEYIVMDGGSHDDTQEILKSYAGRVRFVSEPDGGAADAIRRGFDLCHGSILAYLNADDLYLPGAIATAVEIFEAHPDVAVVYGDGLWIDESGAPIAQYPVRPFDADQLSRECFICQPATFIRREAYEAAGGLDPALRYTYDYDLWLRLARGHRFLYVPKPLAQSRMHSGNKTLGARRQVLRETITTVRSIAGYAPFGHVYAYACHMLDARDQFFEPLLPSAPKFAWALLLGLRFNREGAGRFLREYVQASGLMQTAPNAGGKSQ